MIIFYFWEKVATVSPPTRPIRKSSIVSSRLPCQDEFRICVIRNSQNSQSIATSATIETIRRMWISLFLIVRIELSSHDLKINVKVWAIAAPPIMCIGMSIMGKAE